MAKLSFFSFCLYQFPQNISKLERMQGVTEIFNTQTMTSLHGHLLWINSIFTFALARKYLIANKLATINYRVLIGRIFVLKQILLPINLDWKIHWVCRRSMSLYQPIHYIYYLQMPATNCMCGKFIFITLNQKIKFCSVRKCVTSLSWTWLIKFISFAINQKYRVRIIWV